MRLFPIIFLVLQTVYVNAQKEKVYLDLDKYSCRSGDTLWFKGAVFLNNQPSCVSTILYTDLYNSAGFPVARYRFPIMHGQSIGQIAIPDSLVTDNYFVTARTRQQLGYDSTDFFSVPVLVYNKDRPRTVHHKKLADVPAPLAGGLVKGIFWLTTIYQGGISSLLEVDHFVTPRHLQIRKHRNVDSFEVVSVTIDHSNGSRYSVFTRDSCKASETLFLLEDSNVIGRQQLVFRQPDQPVNVHTDTIDASPFGNNAWTIDIPGRYFYYTSISVTDADRSAIPPCNIYQLNASGTDDLSRPANERDTSFITLSGVATKENGRSIKDPFSQDILLAGSKDSTYLFANTVRVDARGNFRVDSLFFFGKINLNFQINKADFGDTKDLRLRLSELGFPLASKESFDAHWVDDSVPLLASDTLYTKTELDQYERSKYKSLKPVVVKAWKNPRGQLDEKYTWGAFSEPALYVYDLRKYTSIYNRNLKYYIASLGTRIMYDPVADTFSDISGHPIHFFVDQIEIDPRTLQMYDFERMAYIKILESDFLSSQRIQPSFSKVGEGPLKISGQATALNVCIYSRKGTDFRTMRGGLNTIPIKGYDEIYQFHPDRVTLFWDATQSGNSFHARFQNSENAHRFRLKVTGFSYAGELVQYEKIIAPER